MGIGLLNNIKKEINLTGLLSNNINNNDIECTPKQVLGYDLYPEQYKWIDFCYGDLNTTKRIVNIRLLLAARDYGKTDTLIVYKIVDLLKNNPDLKFIIATRKEERAKDILFAISFALKALGFKGKFNKKNIRLDLNSTKTSNISIANSSTSSLRGLHVDILIGDDLVISDDENSETSRKSTIKFYFECLNTTKNIILLGQPVHEQDLYAVLQEIESINNNNIDNNKKELDIKIHKSPHGSIPELDKDLDSLRTLISEREIQKNYNLELISDGLYPFANLTFEEFNFIGHTFACLDPAFQGKDSIGLAIGIKTEHNYKILANKINGNIYDIINEVIKILQHFNVAKCFIESNDNYGVYRKFKELKVIEHSIKFAGYQESNQVKKEVRIRSRIGAVKDKLILHSQSSINEITGWNETVKHDDCVDAIAGLINFLNGNKEKLKVQ